MGCEYQLMLLAKYFLTLRIVSGRIILPFGTLMLPNVSGSIMLSMSQILAGSMLEFNALKCINLKIKF